jgi:hypothetical protein
MATKKYDVAVKTGSYTDNTGANKGRYTNIGVMMQGDNGDFLLLDPAISLGGVLALQNVEAVKQGKQPSDRVMVSLFEPKQQHGGYNAMPQGIPPAQPQQAYQQPMQAQPHQAYAQPTPQQGYAQPAPQHQQPAGIPQYHDAPF